MKLMQTVSCVAARANGITNIYYVTGDRWAVVSRSNAYTPTILAALGGIPGQVSCGRIPAPARD